MKQIVEWSIATARPEEREAIDPELMECINFLELCLELDPRKRISARKALTTGLLKEEGEEDDIDDLQT